jgi:hypothetical protein
MHNTQRNAAPHTPVSSAAARRVQPHVRVHTVLTDRHDTALPTRVYQLRTAGGTAVMAAAVGVATPRLRAHVPAESAALPATSQHKQNIRARLNERLWPSCTEATGTSRRGFEFLRTRQQTRRDSSGPCCTHRQAWAACTVQESCMYSKYHDALTREQPQPTRCHARHGRRGQAVKTEKLARVFLNWAPTASNSARGHGYVHD